MGLYGGMKKPISQKMQINAVMLVRRIIDTKVIMLFLQEEIARYVVETEHLVRSVSTNANVFLINA